MTNPIIDQSIKVLKDNWDNRGLVTDDHFYLILRQIFIDELESAISQTRTEMVEKIKKTRVNMLDINDEFCKGYKGALDDIIQSLSKD